MTMPKKDGRQHRPKLGPKAAATIEIIRKRFAAGEPLSKALVKRATDEAYSLGGSKMLISTYANQNLNREAFLSALGVREFFK
jgi:hypothetical protein